MRYAHEDEWYEGLNKIDMLVAWHVENDYNYHYVYPEDPDYEVAFELFELMGLNVIVKYVPWSNKSEDHHDTLGHFVNIKEKPYIKEKP